MNTCIATYQIDQNSTLLGEESQREESTASIADEWEKEGRESLTTFKTYLEELVNDCSEQALIELHEAYRSSKHAAMGGAFDNAMYNACHNSAITQQSLPPILKKQAC